MKPSPEDDVQGSHIAAGKLVKLRKIQRSDLKQASEFKYTLSITEPLTELPRLAEVYDATGFWLADSGAVAIVEKSADRLIGTSQFYRSGPGIHGYELGYIIHSADDRGKGYASEAVRLMSDFLFAQRPKCFRLQLIIEVWNTASWKLAESCGYVREGVLRKSGYSSLPPEDCFIYSRTR